MSEQQLGDLEGAEAMYMRALDVAPGTQHAIDAVARIRTMRGG